MKRSCRDQEYVSVGQPDEAGQVLGESVSDDRVLALVRVELVNFPAEQVKPEKHAFGREPERGFTELCGDRGPSKNIE